MTVSRSAYLLAKAHHEDGGPPLGPSNVTHAVMTALADVVRKTPSPYGDLHERIEEFQREQPKFFKQMFNVKPR